MVPTLPPAWGGVVNWHGDALPLFAAPLLLRAEGQRPGDVEVSPEALSTGYLLVVSGRPGEQARLGMPIDRVLGLVEGGDAPPPGRELIVERRPVAGRVVSVLDPRHLVARAWEVMECASA